MKNPIEICLYIIAETDRAFLVTDEEGENNLRGKWIPKSQIELEQDAGPRDTIIITMPEWLAIEKGFV